MFGFLIPILQGIATGVLADIAVEAGRELAKRTDNKLDDTVVDVVESALPAVRTKVPKDELAKLTTHAAKTLLCAVGDELAHRTDNALDDRIMSSVRKRLEV